MPAGSYQIVHRCYNVMNLILTLDYDEMEVSASLAESGSIATDRLMSPDAPYSPRLASYFSSVLVHPLQRHATILPKLALA